MQDCFLETHLLYMISQVILREKWSLPKTNNELMRVSIVAMFYILLFICVNVNILHVCKVSINLLRIYMMNTSAIIMFWCDSSGIES